MWQGAGHRSPGALRLVWAFTLGTFLSACYKNVPVAQPAQVVAGSTVRIQLNLEGTRQLERTLGPEVRILTGTVESFRNDTVYVALQETRTLTGQVFPSTGNRVAVARVLIAEMNQRVQNRRNSFLLVLAAIGTAIIVMMAASGAIGGGSGGGGQPPPPPA